MRHERHEQVLVTGGAGFIGTHVARDLLEHGYRVRVLDRLVDQVHGDGDGWPAHLPPAAERYRGSVADRRRLREALDGTDAVIHLAARVGVGQSMYEVADYTRTNNVGTAILMEELVEAGVGRLVVASSMSVYGEGAYVDGDGRRVEASPRSGEQLERREWEVAGPSGDALEPRPTPEDEPPDLASVYALSKFDQERLCLMLGEAYDVPAVALRLFNVYGRHQALSNPYTGVLAIFGSRLLNGEPPLVYEDGLQRRDFVHVSDVARAFRLALEADEPPAGERVVNIGSGTSRTVRSVAERMAEAAGVPHLEPEITGRYRRGDIRHCFADVSRANRVLGYEPRVGFREGVAELAEWLVEQEAEDGVEEANRELAERGLVV